jgi:RNA polymerase sigma-B factor
VTRRTPTGHGPTQPPSSLAEERERFTRLHAHADPRRREHLIETHLGLARHLALRYGATEEPQEDLFQVACVGLIKAVDRYDPERGFAFSSYAVPTILGELRRHFRDRTWAVRMPRAVQDLSLRIDRAVTAWTAEHGRPPGVRELAAHLKVTEEEVLEAIEAAGAHHAAPLALEEHDGEEQDVARAPGVLDEGFEQAERRATLAPLLATLGERERLVLRLRFEEDLTQSEIAARIGVSQMQVSRLIRRGLERLQAEAGADGDGGPG